MDNKDRKAAATILVVEDDAMIAMFMVEMIAEFGFNVLEANSGRQALDALARRPDIALVISDFSMPEMNGLDLANRIAETHPGVPVLLATGYSVLPGDIQSNVPRILKPFTQDQLLAAIEPFVAHLPHA